MALRTAENRSLFMPRLYGDTSNRLEFTCGPDLMKRETVGGLLAFGIAMSMNATTYKAHIPATPAGRDPSSVRPDTPPFQRPGADVLNEAIPAFFIGRNRSGFWVARDANGKSGGLFWSREAALRFARTVWPEGCATIFPQGRFELDIDNAGSPLIAWLEAAKHWLARHSKARLRLPK